MKESVPQSNVFRKTKTERRNAGRKRVHQGWKPEREFQIFASHGEKDMSWDQSWW
jgi:hypothetical protein